MKKITREDIVIAFIDQLAAMPGGTSPDEPIRVKPEMSFTFSTSQSNKKTTIPWGVINAVVKDAKKYIILDLSDCSAEDHIITGCFFPENSIAAGKNDMNTMWNNMYIKGIILPSTLKIIGSWAFYFCFELTTITIPASVDSIQFSAFWNCYDLETITFERGGIDITTETAFDFNNRSLFGAYRKGGAGTYIITEERNWLKRAQ
jgi:hypothetical protein